MTSRLTIPFLGLLALTACSDDETTGVGDVAVSLNGEEGSITGFPVVDGPAFVDGWTLTFSKVLVSVSDFQLASSEGDAAMLPSRAFVADLHKGMPDIAMFEGVPAQRWDRVSYHFSVPTDAAENVNGVADADIARMKAAGATILLEGSATKAETTVNFVFELPNVVHNTHCVSGIDETDGLVVRENTTTGAELTVHLDHLFFDSFSVEEPNMRFDPFAASADASGNLTLEMLRAQNLSDMKAPGGGPLLDAEGNPVVYDPGNFRLTSMTFRDYVVEAGALTMGHFQGEGHCEYER